MKRTIITAVLFTVLSSCTQENTSTVKIPDATRSFSPTASCFQKRTFSDPIADNSTQADLAEFKRLMRKCIVTSQFYSLDATKSQTVAGKKGTVLYINPADLITKDGKLPGRIIRVELKELLTKEELLRSGAQTISDGKLLVSGGSYYIKITSDNKELVLKEGKTLRAEFPKITEEKMSVFYGKRNSNGLMNWKGSGELFGKTETKNKSSFNETESNVTVTKSVNPVISVGPLYDITSMRYVKYENGTYSSIRDTSKMSVIEKQEFKKERELTVKLYDAVNLKSMGWINCDRFMSYSQTTPVTASLEGNEDIEFANAYLVFKDRNSVIQSFYFRGNKTAFNFGNIPIGYKVRLIAFTTKNGKILTYASDLEVKRYEIATIRFKETSEEEFKSLLGS